MAISKKSWLGVAREATSGTAITTPTLYVPTKSNMKALKKREHLDEERGDRNGNYDIIDTTRDASWDIKGPWYNDAHVYFLLAALGSLSSAQQASTTAYKHTLALADIPPTLTLYKSFDAKTYYSPFSFVEKFTLKFSSAEKLLEFDSSGKGLFPVIKSSPPTPTFSAVKPYAGYQPTITLTGGVSADIDELSISFEQKVTPWFAANGSPDFTAIYYGERKVTLDYTARFDNDTVYETYFRAPNVQDTLTFDVQGAQISGSYNQELQLVIPVFSYDSMEHDLGKDNVLIKAKGTALSTGSGAGNNFISGFVQNTKTSYTV
jgi:hypothetical protein